MFTRQESSRIRQAFWTAFGQYMSPVPFAAGVKGSWINYRTGAPDIFFKMDTGDNNATVSIMLTHPDVAVQQEVFDHFAQLKNLLRSATGAKWSWQPPRREASGNIMSRIYRQLDDVNVLRQQDWPALISFFKEGITGLDAFWEEVKDGFQV